MYQVIQDFHVEVPLQSGSYTVRITDFHIMRPRIIDNTGAFLPCSTSTAKLKNVDISIGILVDVEISTTVRNKPPVVEKHKNMYLGNLPVMCGSMFAHHHDLKMSIPSSVFLINGNDRVMVYRERAAMGDPMVSVRNNFTCFDIRYPNTQKCLMQVFTIKIHEEHLRDGHQGGVQHVQI